MKWLQQTFGAPPIPCCFRALMSLPVTESGEIHVKVSCVIRSNSFGLSCSF